jgi:hypothetical protein
VPQTNDYTPPTDTKSICFSSYSPKVWTYLALAAYWLLVRVLRYRRRDGVSRRLNVSKVWPTLMKLGL